MSTLALIKTAALKIYAEATSAIAPNSVGKKRNTHVGDDKNTMIGLDPAGGCTVPVSIIRAQAQETASASDHHSCPKIVRKARPTHELMKCPPTTLLGVENSLSLNAKIRIDDDPKEPNVNAIRRSNEK